MNTIERKKKVRSTEAPANVVEIPTDEAVLAPIVEEAPVETPEETPAAPVTTPTKAKVKGLSERVGEIYSAACTLAAIDGLGVELKEFGSGSFVLRAPSFKEAVKALPQSDDAKACLVLVRGLQESVESLTGDARRTWVFHRSGSFALYSRLQ